MRFFNPIEFQLVAMHIDMSWTLSLNLIQSKGRSIFGFHDQSDKIH